LLSRTLRISGIVVVCTTVFCGTVLWSQSPGTTATATTAATQTAPSKSSATTTEATGQPQKPDPKDEPLLSPTQRLVAIIVGAITIVGALWKLSRKVIFSTLESTSGRKELAEIVHQQFDSAAGRAALAGYVLGHFERDAGRAEFRKFVLSILTSDEAEEPLRKLVTRLIVLREVSKEKVEEHVEALRTQMVDQRVAKPTTQEVQLKKVEIENSTIAQLSADPAANQEEIHALVRKIAVRLGIDDTAKDEPVDPRPAGRKTPGDEPT
jgi:hypothetical protein